MQIVASDPKEKEPAEEESAVVKPQVNDDGNVLDGLVSTENMPGTSNVTQRKLRGHDGNKSISRTMIKSTSKPRNMNRSRKTVSRDSEEDAHDRLSETKQKEAAETMQIAANNPEENEPAEMTPFQSLKLRYRMHQTQRTQEEVGERKELKC